MAGSNEPLLNSPVTRRTNPYSYKFILVSSLSLVAVISLTSLTTLQVATANHQVSSLTLGDLCPRSPNSTSCHAVVSDVLTAAISHRPSTVEVLQTILGKSMQQVDITDYLSRDIYGRTNEAGGRHQAALADCIHLMELSHDRLADSISAVATESHTDTRTWLSAVLTNYDTCLDGLQAQTRAEMEPHLNRLMQMASTSLSVLNAVSPTSASDNHVVEPVVKFPSWVSFMDRKLLEASSVAAVQANVVVAQDGSGKYKTVQAAVDGAPAKSNSRYVIYVKKGTYKEKVVVGKQKINITIVGDGMDATIITGSLNYVDGTSTFDSGTLTAEGDGFMLQDICVQNTAGPQKYEAVAVRVSADRSVINRCRIEAYQNTLYTHTLRQFYRDSTISGTVDFIFGNAAVVFQNCKIVARKPMAKQQNFVTAQGRTDPNQNTGTSIQKCQVVPSSDLNPVKGWIPTYLGRPWKEYSRTVFMQSFIDGHVHAKGWKEWAGTFALRTLYYAEYANKGPGAGTGWRVKWPGYHVITNPNDAKAFTVARLIQGGPWLKSTGVAYTEGL